MASYLLLALIIFSGFLAGFKKENRFNLFKAFCIVEVETMIGSILSSVFMVIILQTPLRNIFFTGVESLFIIVLFIAVINGIILYWANRFIIPKLKINNQVQTLCEYIIQWSLIYITIYQVVFDNLVNTIKTATVESLESMSITNPTDLIILVLPSLISVWIAIILYKVKDETI